MWRRYLFGNAAFVRLVARSFIVERLRGGGASPQAGGGGG